MIRTASVHRVALEYAYRQDRMVRRAYFRHAGMENLLSVEIPLDTDAREWNRFDDPYGRNYDAAVDDLKNVGRSVGMGDLHKAIEDRNSVTFYIKYDEGSNEAKAKYNLEKVLSEKLEAMARNDEGVAALLYGLSGGGRLPNINPESEAWLG